MYISVVELPQYIRKAGRLLDEVDQSSLIFYLSTHPESGVIIQDTGGVRKLRWGRKGMGKRGGVRVIYYFYYEYMPLFMLTIFGKGEKENLSLSERKKLAKLIKLLIDIYKQK